MKLSSRELRLAIATGLALVGVGTYSLISSRWTAWQQLAADREKLEDRLALARQRLDRGPDTERRLAMLRQSLPLAPAEQDVTAQLLRTLEDLAARHGLALTRRDAEKERPTGDLYELSVNCVWEGSLDALTRFLYSVLELGASYDISQLVVNTAGSGRAGLNGTFRLDYAYRRAGAPPPATPAAPPRTPRM